MFTFAGSSLSSRMQAIACAAKASFSSTRSIWSMLSPARLSTFWVAGMGPRPMQPGSTPATAVATMRASGSVSTLPPLPPVTSSAAARLEHHVGSAGHVLAAAGDEHLSLTRLDRLGRARRRLQPGAAQPVHGLPRHLDGEAGEE